MNKLFIEGIKLYAYHGCLEEEASIGGEYIVDMAIEADLKKASFSDQLADTIDYCLIFDIVKKEMAIRSGLIEHVATRIADALKLQFPQIHSLELKVTKLNPPVNGYVEKVSVAVKS